MLSASSGECDFSDDVIVKLRFYEARCHYSIPSFCFQLFLLLTQTHIIYHSYSWCRFPLTQKSCQWNMLLRGLWPLANEVNGNSSCGRRLRGWMLCHVFVPDERETWEVWVSVAQSEAAVTREEIKSLLFLFDTHTHTLVYGDLFNCYKSIHHV